MNVSVTDNAKVKILEALKDSGYKQPALRIVYSGVGWGGPRIGLALDESENSIDLLITANEVDILLGDDIRRYAETDAPITIDYKESRYGEGFVVDNGRSC